MTPAQKITEATKYLEGEGGLGEMAIGASLALESGFNHVAMSPETVIVLLAMAAEALNNRLSDVDRAGHAYTAAQLRRLASPTAEAMSDKARLDAFVRLGFDAANGLDLLADRTATPNKPSVN